jgi:hypothetical protein
MGKKYLGFFLTTALQGIRPRDQRAKESEGNNSLWYRREGKECLPSGLDGLKFPAPLRMSSSTSICISDPCHLPHPGSPDSWFLGRFQRVALIGDWEVRGQLLSPTPPCFGAASVAWARSLHDYTTCHGFSSSSPDRPRSHQEQLSSRADLWVSHYPSDSPSPTHSCVSRILITTSSFGQFELNSVPSQNPGNSLTYSFFSKLLENVIFSSLPVQQCGIVETRLSLMADRPGFVSDSITD